MNAMVDPRGGRLGRRIAAAVLALLWATIFFGIIDLTVVIVQNLDFFEHYLLETGWGLLFTFLVPLPLLAWAVRPQNWNGVQVAAVALAILLAGLVGLAPGQVVVGCLVAGSAALTGLRRPRLAGLRELARVACWPLDLLLLAASGVALFYGWEMLAAARDGVVDDNTNGLMHLPMQAGFGLAIAASAVAASLALVARSPGRRVAFVPAALSASWFGVVARAYPEHVGSIGQFGGTLAIFWGVLLLLTAWATGWLTQHHRQAPTNTP